MEKLFGTKARRAMDYSFMRANKPLPDWTRCALEWEAVDPAQSALPELNGGVPS